MRIVCPPPCSQVLSIYRRARWELDTPRGKATLKTDARTSHKLCVDSFVLGHLQNLVAERILADR